MMARRFGRRALRPLLGESRRLAAIVESFQRPVVHLGVVPALFVTLPYGRFVHGPSRLAVLVKDAAERDADRSV